MKSVSLTKPASTARAAALAVIDAEMKKLAALRGSYEARLKEIECKEQLHWLADDWADYSQLPTKIGDLGKQLRELRDKRVLVDASPEYGVDETLLPVRSQKRAAGRRTRRKWPITAPMAEEPAFPAAAYKRGDSTAISEAWEAFLDHKINSVMKSFESAGVIPDAAASMELLATTAGALNATREWLTERLATQERRIEKLVDRIAELEKAPIRYRGVWQRSEEYHRGHVVSDAGSCWHAAKDVPLGERPGSGNSWQLMVKAGRDAK